MRPLTINAALISAAQKIEHYEMASYGCLHEWAGLLGNREAAGLLKQILEEEADANESLTKLARASSNEEAMGESDEQSREPVTDKKPGNIRRGVRPVSAGRNQSASTSR